VGTTYTQCVYASGQQQCLAATIGSPGASTQHPSVAHPNCNGCAGPTLATDNDGTTSTGNYQLQDPYGNPYGNTSNLGSCSATNAQNITVTYAATPGSTTIFTISATASTVAFAGTYALSCTYDTFPISAGSLIVYDATPVITNVSPSPVAPGPQTISITGHNFGNNPTVTIGGTPAVVPPGVGIGSLVTIYAPFNVPSSAAGTYLQVLLTSTGEFGHAFFQNPQNATASNPQSAAFLVAVSDNGPAITNVTQALTLYPGATNPSNGTYLQIAGNNFGTGAGSVAVCQQNVGFGQPCAASGITASVVNSATNPNALWSNTQVEAQLTASAETAPGKYDVWLTATTDANGNNFVPGPGAPSTAIYLGGVTVSAINIRLLQQGSTDISTDGNYTENTTIQVAAVRAQDGNVVTNFGGTVGIAEDTSNPTYIQIYTQNVPSGAMLPSVATISSGGTTTIVAKSLAGPYAGAAPSDAVLTSTNYPVYQGAELSIAQWVISTGTPIGPIAATGGNEVFDWLQHRILDIRTNSSGYLSTVLGSITSYSVSSTLSGAALTTGTVTEINPFYTVATRLDSASGTNLCGVSQGKDLADTVIHESRHAYQYLQATTIPGNDQDQDLLVNAIMIAPTDIFIDSTASRTVCETTNYTTLAWTYHGDSVKDSFNVPDWGY
jgi:hypothetical protein